MRCIWMGRQDEDFNVILLKDLMAGWQHKLKGLAEAKEYAQSLQTSKPLAEQNVVARQQLPLTSKSVSKR